MKNSELKKKAYEIRKEVRQIITKGKSGYTGGDLSEADLLTALFYDVMKMD